MERTGWAPRNFLLPLPQAAVKVHVALGGDLAVHGVGLVGHSWSCGHEPPCVPPAPLPRAAAPPSTETKQEEARPQGVPVPTLSPVTHSESCHPLQAPPIPALDKVRQDRISLIQNCPFQGSACAPKGRHSPKPKPLHFPVPSLSQGWSCPPTCPRIRSDTPHPQDAPAPGQVTHPIGEEHTSGLQQHPGTLEQALGDERGGNRVRGPGTPPRSPLLGCGGPLTSVHRSSAMCIMLMLTRRSRVAGWVPPQVSQPCDTSSRMGGSRLGSPVAST